MADDTTSRSHRSNDPYRRDPSGSGTYGSGSDPLAELARLIGQGDPFSDPPRSHTRSAEPREPQPTQQPKAPPVSDWRKAVAAMPPYETYHEETRRRQSAQRSEPNFGPAETDYPQHDPYAREESVESRYDARRE